MKKTKNAFCCTMALMAAFMIALSASSITAPAAETSNYLLNGPEDLDFRLFYTGRSLFDSEIPLQEMDYTGVASEGLALHGDGGKLSAVNKSGEDRSAEFELGEMKAWGVYDLEVAAQSGGDNGGDSMACIGMLWKKDAENYVSLQRRVITEKPDELESSRTKDSGYLLKVVRNGKAVVDKILPYNEAPPEAPYTMRAVWIGQFLSTYIVKDGRPVFLSNDELRAHFDFRRPSVIGDFKAYSTMELSPGASLTINRFHSYYTGGNGQADPHVLHYEDGEIIIDDNKMYFSMTCRGYTPLPASYQGIYSIDLTTFEVKLTSVVVFDPVGESEDTLWGYHASTFLYDRISDPDHPRWIVVTSAHGDNKWIRLGALEPGDDPRFTPFIVANVKRQVYSEPLWNLENTNPPGTMRSTGQTEDPALRWDAENERWVTTFCISGFHTVVAMGDTRDALGPYTQWGLYTPGSTTGNQIVKIGGELYGLCGQGEGAFRAFTLPKEKYPPPRPGEVYPNTPRGADSYGTKLAATLKVDVTTNSPNTWPVVLEFPDKETGTTKYILMTFDRNWVQYVNTNPGGGGMAYVYGRLYWYESTTRWTPDDFPETPKAAPHGKNVAEIRTADDLYAIRGDLNGSYTLMNDINMSGFDWYPIGGKEAPFTGTFDGGGHTIRNLSADLPGLNGVGFFGYTSTTAVISNAVLDNVNIAGGVYTGGVVGYNRGKIANVSVRGTVNAEAEGGLLVGHCNGPGEFKDWLAGDPPSKVVDARRNDPCVELIKFCDTAGTVRVKKQSAGGLVGRSTNRVLITQSSSNAAVYGEFNAGGLVGFNGSSTIQDCYATGDVSGVAEVGGLVGASAGQFGTFDTSTISPILRSYATGNVTGEYETGGFIGFNDHNIEDCFSTGSVKGGKTVGGFAGKNNQYGVLKNVFCTAAATAGDSFVGSLIGKNVGIFSDVAFMDNSEHAIGSSLLTVINGTSVPDFTATATYEPGGALSSWNNGAWILSDGKLPVHKK